MSLMKRDPWMVWTECWKVLVHIAPGSRWTRSRLDPDSKCAKPPSQAMEKVKITTVTSLILDKNSDSTTHLPYICHIQKLHEIQTVVTQLKLNIEMKYMILYYQRLEYSLMGTDFFMENNGKADTT